MLLNLMKTTFPNLCLYGNNTKFDLNKEIKFLLFEKIQFKTNNETNMHKH